MKNNFYAKLFAFRSVLSFIVIMMLMFSCVLRIAVISMGEYDAIQSEQSAYRMTVSKLRGTIYDCNMVPLTNTDYKTVAAVSPTTKGITAVKKILPENVRDETLETLKENKPTVCEVNDVIESEGIAYTKVYEHTSENFSACHLIGYTDSTGHGVCGLELAYDDLLYSNKTTDAIFTVDGKGNVLYGIEPYFENDLSVINSGVVTTIDVNIQNITENAIAKMNSGCAVVAEVDSGKIRAMASVPTFDINNLTESFEKENSPLLNRNLLSYSVGSVFKPCVAAAGLKNGLNNRIFNCEGRLQIADRVFRCHNILGHGDMNLCDALAQSCNCFFYNFAIELGGESIYKTASALNFSSKIKIADNLYTSSGIIPTPQALENLGALANISIGQGDLILSPVSMLTLYLSIAGDGSYYLPSVVEKTLKGGVESLYDSGSPTRVMSSEVAALLREYLRSVIDYGTGTEAAPKYCDAAGKTATAQTGRYYDDGSEITNSWFCGFFPAESPKYVAIVMSDSKINVSTASLFAEIADEIALLKNINIQNDD